MGNAVQINAITSMKRRFSCKAVAAPRQCTTFLCFHTAEGIVFSSLLRPRGHQPPTMLQQRSKASHRELLPLIVPAMLINAANPNLSGKREQFPHYGGSRKWRGDRGARCLQRAAQMASSPSSKTDRRDGAEGRHTHTLTFNVLVCRYAAKEELEFMHSDNMKSIRV